MCEVTGKGVDIYSPLSSGTDVLKTSRLPPLVLEVTPERSHLPGETATLHVLDSKNLIAIPTVHFPFRQVPITVG